MSVNTNNMIGKNPANIGQTQVFNTDGGLATSSVDISHDKYSIDLYNDMMTHQIESVPLLTILNAMGSGTCEADTYTWQDEYKGDQLYDVALDMLRLRAVAGGTMAIDTAVSGSASSSSDLLPFTNDSQLGGKLNFKSASLHATTKDITLTASDYATITGGKCYIGSDNVNIQGSLDTVAQRFYELLRNMGYVSATEGMTAGNFTLTVSSSVSVPVYMMFDNLTIADSAANNAKVFVYQSVIIPVNSFCYNQTGKLAIELDLTGANEALQSADNSILLFSVPSANRDYFDNNITTVGRMLFVGQRSTAPLPVPQGDNFNAGGNFTTHREEKSNYTQIFTTKKYGLTGTKLASNFRFDRGMQESREWYFTIYKNNIDAAAKFGQKKRGIVSNASNTFAEGQDVTAVGGLLDYSLYQIKYLYAPIPIAGYSANANSAAQALVDWIDRLADNLSAFRVKSAKSITLLVPERIIKRLNPLVRLTMASSGFMGGSVQINQPSSLTMGLKIYSFDSSNGITVNFIHDPSLDFTTKLPIPRFVFGVTDIPGRNVMIMIDKGNMKKRTLRGDKIEGNLQDIGQDAVLEGMRGEHTFEFRYPKNFAVVLAPDGSTVS